MITILQIDSTKLRARSRISTIPVCNTMVFMPFLRAQRHTHTHNALTGARTTTARIKLCITYTFYSKNAVASTRQLLANKASWLHVLRFGKCTATIWYTHSAFSRIELYIFYRETHSICIIHAGFSFSIIIIEWRWRTSTSSLDCGRYRITSE